MAILKSESWKYKVVHCTLPVVIRKKIKRGGSTVIWKWKGGYKSAPENDFPIEIGNSESAKSCMMPSYARIRSRNRFPVSGIRFPVRICAPIFISRLLRLIFFLINSDKSWPFSLWVGGKGEAVALPDIRRDRSHSWSAREVTSSWVDADITFAWAQ